MKKIIKLSELIKGRIMDCFREVVHGRIKENTSKTLDKSKR